jgi:hypothetical protein
MALTPGRLIPLNQVAPRYIIQVPGYDGKRVVTGNCPVSYAGGSDVNLWAVSFMDGGFIWYDNAVASASNCPGVIFLGVSDPAEQI